VSATNRGALYSFVSDASPEFQGRVEVLLQEGANDLSSRLSRSQLGDDESLPFASARVGDTIEVLVPLTIVRGDLLAELILLVASKVPTCVLREGNTGWAEPQWTSESSRYLLGFVSAMQGAPASFTTSSSPVDLVRLAMWITACNSSLSRPGGVKDAHGSVVPTQVGGAKSAAKYLDRAFGTLRAISSERQTQVAIATLERLLKLWIKSQADEAKELVRKCKLSWGSVLLAGAPTERIKKKKEIFTRIKSPSKPSKSPFLSGKERTSLSDILSTKWDRIEDMRKEWNLLSSQDQHSQYHTYVGRVKSYYEGIGQISSSVHAKLGHRKKWIHSACISAGVEPKGKKDKSNEFTWTQAFFKLDTKSIKLPIALVFSPAHYLTGSEFDNTATLDLLWSLNRKVTTLDCTTANCGPSKVLWEEWCERFSPNLSIPKDIVPSALALEDDNPFKVLQTQADKKPDMLDNSPPRPVPGDWASEAKGKGDEW
jgi:hypothetical protein